MNKTQKKKLGSKRPEKNPLIRKYTKQTQPMCIISLHVATLLLLLNPTDMIGLIMLVKYSKILKTKTQKYACSRLANT